MTILTHSSMILHVDYKFCGRRKYFATKVAGESQRKFSYWMILPDMITEAVHPGECLLTQLAGEILFKNFVLLQVSPPVFLEVLLLGEYLPTLLALVPLAGRGLLVRPVALC